MCSKSPHCLQSAGSHIGDVAKLSPQSALDRFRPRLGLYSGLGRTAAPEGPAWHHHALCCPRPPARCLRSSVLLTFGNCIYIYPLFIERLASLAARLLNSDERDAVAGGGGNEFG